MHIPWGYCGSSGVCDHSYSYFLHGNGRGGYSSHVEEEHRSGVHMVVVMIITMVKEHMQFSQ